MALPDKLRCVARPIVGARHTYMVGVAQLVEPLVVVQVVVGSSPIAHPSSRTARQIAAGEVIVFARLMSQPRTSEM